MDREIPKKERQRTRIKLIIRIAMIAVVAIIAMIGISNFLEPVLSGNNLTIARVDRGTIEMTMNASGKLVPQNEEIIISPINSRILGQR